MGSGSETSLIVFFECESNREALSSVTRVYPSMWSHYPGFRTMTDREVSERKRKLIRGLKPQGK